MTEVGVTAVALLFALAPAAAGTAGAIEAGGWNGGPEFEREAFVRCSMIRVEGEGRSFRIAIDAAGNLVLAFILPDWTTAEREAASPLRLTIDAAGPDDVPATVGDEGVAATLRLDAEFVRRLRQGAVLTLRLGRLAASIPLTGTNAALPALERCADLWR
jgi:hypothetical protein